MCHVDAPVTTIVLFRLSSYQLSAAELFQLPPQRFGLHCRISIIHRLVPASNAKAVFRFQRNFCRQHIDNQ